MEQIPFIHSTQYIIRGKFRSYFFSIWYLQACHGTVQICQLRTRSWGKVEGHCSSFVSFPMVRSSAYWHKIDGIYARAPTEQIIWSTTSCCPIKIFLSFIVCALFFCFYFLFFFACLFPKQRFPFANSKKFFDYTIRGRYGLS